MRVFDGAGGGELTFWFAYDFNFLGGVYVAGQGPLVITSRPDRHC